MAVNILITKQEYVPESGKCVFRFNQTVPLFDKEIALINGTFYNSFMNVTAGNANNVFEFTFPVYAGGVALTNTYTLTLPDGFYSIDQINQAFQNFFIINGLYLIDPVSGRNIYFLNVSANSARYLTQVDSYYIPTESQRSTLGWTYPSSTLICNPGTYAVAPNVRFVDKSADMFGFASDTLIPSLLLPQTIATAWPSYPTASVFGTSAPSVNPVSSVIIRCNMINSAVINPTDMLVQAPVSAAFGAQDTYHTSMPTFTPIVPGNYDTLEFSFIDQNKRKLYFFDRDMTWSVQIRDARK